MDNQHSPKKNVSLERRIQAYPPPKYFGLVEAMSKCDEISKSEVINIAVKNFFDNMTTEQRARIIQQGKNHY